MAEAFGETFLLSGLSAKVAELRRFLRDCLAGAKNVGWQFELLGKVRHSVTYRAITVTPFIVKVRKLPGITGAKIVPLSDISSLPVSNLTRKVARAALLAATSFAKKR